MRPTEELKCYANIYEKYCSILKNVQKKYLTKPTFLKNIGTFLKKCWNIFINSHEVGRWKQKKHILDGIWWTES
jgi:hypothetical protein